MSRVEYLTIPVTVSCPDAPDETFNTTAARYACCCGHEGVSFPCASYEFPTCEACGQPIMPERERLESQR